MEIDMSKKQSVHYVNNADFSQAVVDYVTKVNKARDKGKPHPVVPDYIAQCFLRIAEGLSHKHNFIRYTYREEMVMDAVENCLKAIYNAPCPPILMPVMALPFLEALVLYFLSTSLINSFDMYVSY